MFKDIVLYYLCNMIYIYMSYANQIWCSYRGWINNAKSRCSHLQMLRLWGCAALWLQRGHTGGAVFGAGEGGLGRTPIFSRSWIRNQLVGSIKLPTLCFFLVGSNLMQYVVVMVMVMVMVILRVFLLGSYYSDPCQISTKEGNKNSPPPEIKDYPRFQKGAILPVPQLKVLALSCQAAISLQFFFFEIYWNLKYFVTFKVGSREVFLFCHKVPQDLSKALNAGHHGNGGCAWTANFLCKSLDSWGHGFGWMIAILHCAWPLWVVSWRSTCFSDHIWISCPGGSYDVASEEPKKRGRWMTRLPWGILGGLLAVYGGFVGWLGLLLSRLALQSLAVTGVYEVMYSSVFSYHALWVKETWIFLLSLQTRPKLEFCETGIFSTPLEPGEFWFVWDYMVFEVTHGRSFEWMCEALIPKLTCWDFQPMGLWALSSSQRGSVLEFIFNLNCFLVKYFLPFRSSVTSHFQLTNCESLSTAKGLRKSEEQRYSNTIKGFFLFTYMVCFFLGKTIAS